MHSKENHRLGFSEPHKRISAMRYIKKTCILRQLKNGFSADGNPLSGIVKVEQYAQHIGLEISTANLAPLSEGEYHLLIADSEIGRAHV